jgi:Bacteriocin-protection, YdeI or OmpD-Associated
MEVLAPSLTVVEKLQIKDEKNMLIQGLPSTIEKQFAKLSFSKNVTPLLKIRKVDLALVFAVNHRQLTDILKDVVPALHADAILWIASPKPSSKIVSDLSRDRNWQCTAALNLECIRTIELDNVWCAMRFKKSENIKIATAINHSLSNEIEGVDYITHTVTPPIELEALFIKHKKAKAFFQSLSFVNQKAYIVWIAGAKKDETRLARINTVLEQLLQGKNNPADK